MPQHHQKYLSHNTTHQNDLIHIAFVCETCATQFPPHIPVALLQRSAQLWQWQHHPPLHPPCERHEIQKGACSFMYRIYLGILWSQARSYVMTLKRVSNHSITAPYRDELEHEKAPNILKHRLILATLRRNTMWRWCIWIGGLIWVQCWSPYNSAWNADKFVGCRM